MNIPILNPQKANEPIQQELEEAALRVLRSGQYILGKEVSDFEQQIAEYLGCKYAVGMSSGTDALLASLMALDIGPGDEVICPSFTFFATAGSISRVGATPVFVDIQRDCFTISPADIIKNISPRTKAIIPVHLFGQSADMDAINEIADKHGLYVIEDACQAIGASLGSKKVGTIGTVGTYSFFPSKNLGGFGDSGLVTTNFESIYQKLLSIRNHGSKVRYYHDTVGANFRIDAIQAALLGVKLKHLPKDETLRVRNARLYNENIKNPKVTTPPVCRGVHTYNQYTIRVHGGARNSLQSTLQDAGIGTGIYYPLPLHKQVCFTPENSICSQSMSETDFAATEVLSLPISSEITEEQIEYICEKINAF